MAGYYYEVLETVEEPEFICEGNAGELIAIKEVEKEKYIVVIYRELEKEDGFVITAFLTRRREQFARRKKCGRSPRSEENTRPRPRST
jgi:hypothetical protein